MPNLNETDQVLLESCMDEIRSVVGESCSEKRMVETIMRHRFDCSKALDEILNSNTSAVSSTSTEKRNNEPMETGRPKCLICHL